jgi:Putative auto-transporter adhesin, head GIN domain
MKHKASMLIGAAVAAFLILPASGANGDWVTWPTKSFDARVLRVNDIVGNVRVNVQDGPMRVDVSGNRDLVAGLTVRNDNGTLLISGRDVDSFNVWDWRKWFDFSHIGDEHNGRMFIKVTVPKGTDVRIDDLVGDANIGDTFGPVRLESTAGNSTVGRTSAARIGMAGSGKMAVADVAGELRIDIAGSGHVMAHNADSVRADIAGSGDATVGAIASGLKVDIAGSGDLTVSKVNGPVKVDIAGSGNVKIADGLANPLRVDILGAGDFYFGGLAVDPSVTAMGSGNVHIKAYKGRFRNDGMADVVIGDQVMPAGPVPPVPPVPGVHPLPPKPPAPPHHGDDDDDN